MQCGSKPLLALRWQVFLLHIEFSPETYTQIKFVFFDSDCLFCLSQLREKIDYVFKWSFRDTVQYVSGEALWTVSHTLTCLFLVHIVTNSTLPQHLKKTPPPGTNLNLALRNSHLFLYILADVFNIWPSDISYLILSRNFMY